MMYIYAKVMLYCVYNTNSLIFLAYTKITSMLVLMAGGQHGQVTERWSSSVDM